MTETRRQILVALQELSDRYPTMRFGQLVITVATSAKGVSISSVYDVEDHEFLKAAGELKERHVQE